MKPAFRRLAWSPLLLVGLALAYGAVTSWDGESCAEERAGRAAGLAITGVFAAYFVASYFLLVARRYLLMAIASLFAWHLGGFTPFFTTSCSEAKTLGRIAQATGYSVNDLAAASVAIASVTGLSLYLRFRRMDGWSQTSQRLFVRLTLGGAAAIAVALCVWTLSAVPRLLGSDALSSSDLPAPSLLLFNAYVAVVAVPLGGMVVLAHFGFRSRADWRRPANWAIGEWLVLNAIASFLFVSLLLPVKTMCSCI